MKHVTFLVLLAVLVGFTYSSFGVEGDLVQTFNNPVLTANDGFGYSVLAVGDNSLLLLDAGMPFDRTH